MANWVIQCSEAWLKPLYKHMKQKLMTHSVIHADETVVQVLKGDDEPATSEPRMWLFGDAPKGAEASAIVYSIVETAKAYGMEPFAYLQHVLLQLPYLGKNHSHEELESLMPWAPYIQQHFAIKNSDAYTNTYLN